MMAVQAGLELAVWIRLAVNFPETHLPQFLEMGIKDVSYHTLAPLHNKAH